MTAGNWHHHLEPPNLEAERVERGITPTEYVEACERLAFREVVSRYEMGREEWDAVLLEHRPPAPRPVERENWWRLTAGVIAFVAAVATLPGLVDLVAAWVTA